MKTQPKIGISKERLRQLAFSILCFIPLIVTTITIGVGLMQNGYSIWFAIPAALTALAIGFGYAHSVSDLTDFLVPTIIIMVLALIMVPVISKSKENERKRHERTEQRIRSKKTANRVNRVQ